MICPGCNECYACRLRANGVQVSPSATPNRCRNRTQPYRPHTEPSYEKGYIGEHRVDGSFMPVLSPKTGRPMQMHEAMGQRTRIDEGIRRARTDPTLFAPKAGSA